MPISINYPPVGVTLSDSPTIKELANRSTNTFTTNIRRTLDGRSLIGRLQGFPMRMHNARVALSDLYPSGVNTTVDNTRTGGGGGGGGGGVGITKVQ